MRTVYQSKANNYRVLKEVIFSKRRSLPVVNWMKWEYRYNLSLNFGGCGFIIPQIYDYLAKRDLISRNREGILIPNVSEFIYWIMLHGD